MLENLNDKNVNIAEEVCNTMSSNFSAWDADDEIEKKLRKKEKKIKHLRKKVKRKRGAGKKNKKKIKLLKKQIRKLQKEKERQEETLKAQLLQASHQNDMLRLFCMLQMNGGKEYLTKQFLQSGSKGVLEDYERK